MLSSNEVRDALLRCSYENWTWRFREVEGGFIIWNLYCRKDVLTGEEGLSKDTRKWFIEDWRDINYVVRTAFLCGFTNIEHEYRERFMFDDMPIFGPHIDLLGASKFDIVDLS